MDKKIIAAIVVVVVIIAAAAIIIVANDDNDDDKKSYGTSTNADSRLTVFGNANGDDYIDDRDIETLQAILDGTQEATYFDCKTSYGGNTVQRSYADTNADGKIDQADLTLLRQIVDRQQNIQIKFYDVDGVISS